MVRLARRIDRPAVSSGMIDAMHVRFPDRNRYSQIMNRISTGNFAKVPRLEVLLDNTESLPNLLSFKFRYFDVFPFNLGGIICVIHFHNFLIDIVADDLPIGVEEPTSPALVR
jgi:hypothetical protein